MALLALLGALLLGEPLAGAVIGQMVSRATRSNATRTIEELYSALDPNTS